MLKRIAITGPESTGKSWLAHKLAVHYNTGFVEEYSRKYFQNRKYEYELSDLLVIAERQLYYENEAALISEHLLFCDTDILNIKIWARVVFGKVPEWIENKYKEHVYDMYLLCYPDIEWRADPLRSNPNDRQYIYDLFVNELEQSNFNFQVVTGQNNSRYLNAVNFVDELLRNDT